MNNAVSLIFANGQWNQGGLTHLPVSIEWGDRANHITLRIPKNVILTEPLHIQYLNGCDGLQRHIVLEENSRLVLIEEYISDQQDRYQTDSNMQLTLSEGAVMDYYKIQQESTRATHANTICVTQKAASQIKMFFADGGSRETHSDITINLSEKNAVCYLHGIYFLNHDQQALQQTIHVEHAGESGKSAIVFKGVLDKKSRAHFQGKVYVHGTAKRTHAHQENHHLLLSNDAEASSKPQLEIYSEDIRCTHGATMGQLDKEAMFYLQSRGIPSDEALKILTEAFIAEIMNNIESVPIRNYIRQKVIQHESVGL